MMVPSPAGRRAARSDVSRLAAALSRPVKGSSSRSSLRRMQQRARQRRALDQPATERARRIARPGEELDLVQRLARRPAAASGRPCSRATNSRFSCRVRSSYSIARCDRSPMAARLRGSAVRTGQAVEQHLPRRGPQQSRQDPQQRRLPDAVGPGHRDGLAFRERRGRPQSSTTRSPKLRRSAGGLEQDRRSRRDGW